MSNKRITVSVNKLSNNVIPKSEEEKGLKKVDVGLASSREELASISKYKKASISEQRNMLRQQQGLPVSIDVDEAKKTDAAKRNSNKISTGRPLEITDGQIYTFEPLTKDSLQKSIDYVDTEIEKLKAQGASTDWFTAIGNFGLRLGGMEGVDRTELNQQLSDLQSQRAVYTSYLEGLQKNEDLEKIKSDVLAENKFGAIFNIDNEQKLYFLNAGEEGYSSDSYYARKDKKEQLKAELQSMGYDDIERYIENYSEYRSGKTIEPILEFIEKGIVKSPVAGGALATVANIATSPMRGVGQAFDSITEAMGIHGYSAASLPAQVSELTVQKVNERINEKFKNPHAAGLVRVVYNAAVSGAESMMSMGTFGKFGEAVLGLNAATSTYKSAKERGLSDGQALINGVAAGIFESLFEHMSLEKLRAFQASPATTLKPFIKNVLIQSGVEGTEEVFTDIANEAYDYFVNGGLSQYEEALRSGVTPEEYGRQFIAQLGETFITGALAGGGMIGMSAAPGATLGSVSQIIADKKTGNKIRAEDETGAVIDRANEQGGKVGRNAAKIEKRLTAGENVSDRKIGQLDRKTTKAERERAVDTILSSADYKEVSGKEKRAIRSSVLTFFNNPMKLDELQRDVLQTENGKSVLKGVYEWQYEEINTKIETAKETKSSNIRAAVAEGNTETLVKKSFEAETTDGHKVSAGAVRGIVDGELEIVQDKATGATAKLSQLKIQDEDAGKLYNALQRAATGNSPMTADAMNIALSMYNEYENTAPEAYISWAHDAYKAGMLKKDNTVLSFAEFEKMFEGSYSGDITREQLYQMYEAGARSLETKPGVTIIGTAGVTKQQAEQIFIIDEVAKKAGVPVVVINGKLTDEDGRSVNGLYKAGTDRIVLSLENNSDLILTHAGHEMFHWAKEQGEQWGEFLQDTVINVLKSDSKYDFEGIYRERAEAYDGCSEAEILEEIAAQYLGVAFSSENNIRKIVDEASAEERSFLKKLIARLKEFLDDIKQRMKLYANTNKTVRAAVETPVEQLDYIADMFMTALNEVGKTKNPATEEGGVKASLSKEDITAVQSFKSQKSVNDFESSDIEKTKVLAEIFYKDIKTKSPFFRAWFGDWREYDTTPVVVANKKGNTRVPIKNNDTGWSIQVSGKVFRETKTHRSAATRAAVKYLAYIDSIVENAVLLDTFSIGEIKSENSLLMHSFYSVADIGNGPELLKLYVEEMNNPNKKETDKRTYKLLNIEKASAASARVQNYPSSVTNTAKLVFRRRVSFISVFLRLSSL